MTSLVGVSSYLPDARTAVGTYLRRYGLTDKEIRVYERYYGFAEIRVDPGVGIAEQLVAAGRALKELHGNEHRVRYVLQARTMPVATPYPLNPLHAARDELGLSHAATFTVNQQACASGLLSVHLAGRMLAADGDPDALALVFVGEKTFTTNAQVLPVTAVMGEGVAAVLVSAHGERDKVLGYAARTHGQFYRGARMTHEDNTIFTENYSKTLAEVITAALDAAGLTKDDIDLILPHHVNRLSWLKVMKTLGIRLHERLFLDNQAGLGHCFGADAFINYQAARAGGRLKPGDRYLMTSVGLGATFSAMVCQC